MKYRLVAAAFSAFLFFSVAAIASGPDLVVNKPKIDMDAIRAGMAASPRTVAIAQPMHVDLNSGSWSFENGRWTWSYAVEVAGASRLFFVAADAEVPSGSRIVVGNGASFSNEYFPIDIVKGKFSPALVRGERMVIQIFTNNKDAVKFSFDKLYVGTLSRAELQSYQSKYAMAKSAGTLPSVCGTSGYYSVECRAALGVNYLCHISAANKLQSRGVVGLTITDATHSEACSGTLVNNQKSDGKNYILTAAHCDVASDVTVTAYWDRSNSCGADQENFFDQAGPVSNGYTTVHILRGQDNPYNPIALNDSWMLYSAAAIPSGANPIWQGLDATAPMAADRAQETSFTETIVIGHGTALTKQYMYNQGPVYNGGPDATYDTVSWDSSYITNPTGIGASAPGFSGSGLFDQNHRLRGILSASSTDQTDNTYFFRLDLAWDGVQYADHGYTSVSPALKALLDPDNSGNRIVLSFKDSARSDNIDVLFTADQAKNVASGTMLTFSYITDDATSCTASASPANSGWTGAIAPSNVAVSNATVTAASGTQTFTLTCINSVGFSKSRVVTLNAVSAGGGSTGGGATGGSSSNGSSGGGALDWAALCGLLFGRVLRRAYLQRGYRPRHLQ